MKKEAPSYFNRVRSTLIGTGALFGASCLSAVTIDFDEPEYTAAPGDTVAVTLSFDASIPDGLAGYQLRLNAAGSGLFDSDASSITIVSDLDNNLFGDGPAERTLGSNLAEVFGFSESGQAYGGVEFVTFDLAIDPDAGPGTYVLSLELPQEDSFVDGELQVIDDDLVFGSSSLVIEVPAPSLSEAPRYNGDAESFEVTFTGVPGRSYVLEASEDLGEWEALATLTAEPSGLIEYEDTSAASFSQRFYRLVD